MKGLNLTALWVVIGIVVFALLANVALALYGKTASKNAVLATQDTSYTVNGHVYNVTGNGEDASSAVQGVQDDINTARFIMNSLFGIAILIAVILGVVDLIKGGHKG